MLQFGMAKKRMTLDEIEAARRRAVTMFERFGDDESALEFSNMTAEAYAERKGIEVINSNPNQRRRIGKMSFNKKQYEQLRSYIATITEDALSSNSRADLRATLEEISDITADEVNLVFNDDGAVEIEKSEPEAADDEGDEFDDDEE
jgi:hypothetical protein